MGVCATWDGNHSLVKELASTAPIADPPHLPEVQLPTCVIQAPTVLTFKCSSGIESFSADRSWCLSAVSAIKSIQAKAVDAGVLVEDLEGLNSSALMFSRKILSRLSSFVATRVPADCPDLSPGSHWHWESFTNKLQRISVLCALSGHIPNSLNLRQVHESYVASADNFLEVQNGDLSTLDGSYIVEDSSSRSTIIRARATEQGFCKK